METATLEQRLDEVLGSIRRINALVVVIAFASYGLAWYVWTLGQSLGALVIATLGYLLFRSMRKISFNLTWQSYARRPGYPPILQCLDEDQVLRPLEQIRAHVKQSIEESSK